MDIIAACRHCHRCCKREPILIRRSCGASPSWRWPVREKNASVTRLISDLIAFASSWCRLSNLVNFSMPPVLSRSSVSVLGTQSAVITCYTISVASLDKLFGLHILMGVCRNFARLELPFLGERLCRSPVSIPQDPYKYDCRNHINRSHHHKRDQVQTVDDLIPIDVKHHAIKPQSAFAKTGMLKMEITKERSMRERIGG
jgi:hypothetical protein